MKTSLQVSTITRSELKDLLSTVEHPTFISMISNTGVKMRKTNNPYVGVHKISEKYRIIIGFDYEKSVNRRRKKEGLEPINTNPSNKEQWFELVSKGLVKDKKTGEKFYIRYMSLKGSTLSTEYIFNGDPIEKQLFEDFVIQSSNYENQGLENPVMFQVTELCNLSEISIKGNHYILTD